LGKTLGKQADDHHPSSLVGRNTVRVLGLGFMVAAVGMVSPKERDRVAVKVAIIAEGIARRCSHCRSVSVITGVVRFSVRQTSGAGRAPNR